MAKKINEIFQILSEEMNFLKKEYKVDKIGVFGSYSRNEMGSSSDLDLLVEFTNIISMFKFIELERYLSEKLGIKVDLVTKNALRREIKEYVLKDLVYA